MLMNARLEHISATSMPTAKILRVHTPAPASQDGVATD